MARFSQIVPLLLSLVSVTALVPLTTTLNARFPAFIESHWPHQRRRTWKAAQRNGCGSPRSTTQIQASMKNGYTVEDTTANRLAGAAALVHLEQTIASLNDSNTRLVEGPGNALVARDGNGNVVSINSLLFTSVVNITQQPQVSSPSSYVLVIVPSNARVDEAILSEEVGMPMALAESSHLVRLCGFAAGCIPPFGFLERPILTIVDESLREKQLLVAGGGRPNRALMTNFATLKEQVARPWRMASVSTASMAETEPNQGASKPQFFPIEPPNVNSMSRNTVHPVTVVGKIRSVRRMSKELAFCDLDPPAGTFGSAHSWRTPMTGEDLAVQLIAGETLERASPGASRVLQPDQLVMVHGQVSHSEASIQNWHCNRTLDITVSSFSLLQMSTDKEQTRVTQKVARRRQVAQANVPVDPSQCLQIPNVYNVTSVDDCVVMVDDMKSIDQFAASLKRILRGDLSESGTQHMPLVGIDCEWQPSYLLEDSKTPQPVLLLQICLHSLQKVYLFDLQTLFRPLLSPTQVMDKLEKEASIALSALFESKKILKVGFQIAQDLRLLAASYPHVEALQFYNSVLECSTIGKKALRLSKRTDSKEVTSSLGRMAEHFIGKKLNKMEQCSDWSSRPLSSSQIVYSAIDAIVTPYMVESIVRESAINWYGATSRFGVDENDHSLKTLVSSWRFVLFESMSDEIQKKLRARRAVGDAFVIAQSWTTGDVPPQIPIPEIGDGSYRDTGGTVQVPAKQLAIKTSTVLQKYAGELLGQTKEKCLRKVLEESVQEEARLDFPPRKGFIEFTNAYALFVNLPVGTKTSYPNKWLDGGKGLTWYIRESELRKGEFVLGEGDDQKNVVLFIRQGFKGPYVFCGSCRASQASDSVGQNQNSWAIVELRLELIDWAQLKDKSLFRNLVSSQDGEELNIAQ